MLSKNAEKWVEALESGKYQQCKDTLRLPSGGAYCCLGVACELFIESGGALEREREGYVEPSGEFYSDVLPPSVQEWIGLSSNIGDNAEEDELSVLNDSGVDFPTIAKFIREEPKQLFIR